MEQLLREMNKSGIKLRLDGGELRVNAPAGALTDELRLALRTNKSQIVSLLQSGRTADEPLPQLTADPAQRAQPFALTDLQHAYWLGRDSAMEMGNVATHLYVELDCEHLQVERLNDALCRMIDRHDMLRAVVGGDGMQRILSDVPRYQIMVTNASGLDDVSAVDAAMTTRNLLSHQVLKADKWPLFDIRATLMPAERVRLHVSLDLLILDAWSIFLFFKEWHQLYETPNSVPPKFEISFREYVLAERSLQHSDAHQRAHSYWMDRIDSLPAAPDLPLRTDTSARQSPRFSRREARLEKSRWDKLRISARDKGLTPSGLLLAAYSEVLARWSSSPHFTLNVTVSNRLPMHAEVNNLLGDFTSLVMQEVDLRDTSLTFLDRARGLQKQFLSDMDHREVGGVTVIREWAKRRGTALQAVMPVVFSSGLIWSGDEEPGDLEQFGKKIYSVSQTSQVWLDHHVMELNGDLVFIWDAVDAVFEEGVLDAMFGAYCALVERLADDKEVWDRKDVVALPVEMQKRREAANQTAAELPHQCLHAGFVEQALRNPQAVAVIAAQRTISYGELLAESCAVADWLTGAGLRSGQPVAVVMRKGWEQIVAVYGVLLAGGAYMPIDADLPAKRQLDLLRIGEVKLVLTQAGTAAEELNTDEWKIRSICANKRAEYGAAHAKSLDGPLDQLAYVIFTSGTTGVPKGVMIDHRGAVNTVQHINRMYGVGPQDRVLAVSSLSFDLSVYDIFGPLSAGGALVVPDYRKGHDPIHWRDLIVSHQVTLWNSAPQLMRMLMDSFSDGQDETAPIRTVLLSGDFIALDLPQRIRERYTQAQVISLGGATEASIWSIYYPVQAIEPGWISIPYGKPLPNQTIWVLDKAQRVCPDHVKGRIFIGGLGLASGYWRDAAKTAERFITHPTTGERLYDTGDLGRYACDGNVSILGRDDGQVKIQGHRVELGEIEAVLNQHGGVRQSVVLAVVGPKKDRQLVAYVELSDRELSEQSLRDHLADRLPDYMVPRHLRVLDAMPVSVNGKIDYRALPEVSADADSARHNLVLPRNEIEQAIFDAWCCVITDCEVGVTDNFFDLGVDSIVATQLVRELNTILPAFNLEMHELFESLTIEALAVLYQGRERERESEGEVGTSQDSGSPEQIEAAFAADAKLMLEDVQVAAKSFEDIDFTGPVVGQSASAFTPKAVLLTGATGWIGAQVLFELLSLTTATVHCLVRQRGSADSRVRLIEALRSQGLEFDPSWQDRLVIVDGDLGPQFGLDNAAWRKLAESVDAIYHLGASLNVMVDYATHRKVNVDSVTSVVRLAALHHVKPVFFCSPMAASRRLSAGGMVMLHEEQSHPDPMGIPTGYAQSKWVGEQILLAAAARGLPVKVYRTSHALPSIRNGQVKPDDTYATVLRTACAAGVVPDWDDSAFNGVPVDVLARMIVENSQVLDGQHGVVHLENRNPSSLKSIVGILLADKSNGTSDAACVSIEDWKARCLQAAVHLPDESASLASFLFVTRPTGAAVEHMFAAHPLDTGHFERLGQASKLSHLTSATYWRKVRSSAGW